MSPSPPPVDAVSASAVVQTSFGKFYACASTFEPIAVATYTVSNQTAAMSSTVMPSLASWPPQIFYFLTMLIGLVLMFVGFALIRPINFVVGVYIGLTTSILLLTLFAPESTSCTVVFVLPIFFALLLGSLFACKRGSMFAVMGLILGEIAGRLCFNLMLLVVDAPDYMAFTFIGFFAVLVSTKGTHRGSSCMHMPVLSTLA